MIRNESDIAQIARAGFGANRHTLFSAHQMGGCQMGADPGASVVDAHGRHHDLDNLWITDGSIFPTSLGVNPQLSIYAIARKLAGEIPLS
jgi:choline dehydrogenase-like flavoprotein